MTDHPTSDEHLLLASAYVDGELTADQRARAEGDPVVMSMVEELRDVRRQLQVTSPPDEPQRDAAIAAALAATPPIASTAARRRARWMAPLAAAAAAIVVVVGGVIALRSVSDDDGDDQASLEVATRAEGEEDAGAAATTVPAAPQLAAADTAVEAEAEATEGREAAATTAAAGGAVVLLTPADLLAFAGVPPAADESASGSEALCRTGDRFLGVAQVQTDAGLVDVEVYDVADPAERVAVDRQTCEVVLRATP